jgi:hypothetical protein
MKAAMRLMVKRSRTKSRALEKDCSSIEGTVRCQPADL